VGGWWAFVPEQGYTNMARVSALWLDTAITAEGRSSAFQMVNVMQPLLPAGYEILLGQWASAANTSFDYLTTLRYANQCANGTCRVTRAGDVAMMDALMGMTGAMQTVDYRPEPVLVGYTSIDGVGVEYKSDLAVNQQAKFTEMQDFFNTVNANATDSHQFILGSLGSDGTPTVLTTVANCDATCLEYLTRPDGPLGQALQQNSGTMTVLGSGGQEVLTAYAPVPGTSLGLAVQMNKQDCVNTIVAAATTLVDWINENFSVGTEELELTALTTVNGVATFTHLSKMKFAAGCPNGVCLNTTPYLEAAKANCSSGVMRTTDYRGVSVVAGYYCIADMNVYLSMKMDDSEMQSQLLSAAVEYINNRNTQDTATTDEFFLAQPKNGGNVGNMTSWTQVNVLTVLKQANQCIHANCTWDSPLLVRALQDAPGDLPTTATGYNYAGVPITAAIDYDSTVGVAMMMDMDTTAFMATIVSTATYVLVFATAVVVAATVALIVLTKHMMKAMILASDEGKRAVEHERQQFSALVESMYPAYVVPRLLAGDQHIVSHLKHTAVFFSDIFEFTSASNTISPEELVQFMGYTYGVMDDIAGRFGVYKVKTVGDAYLAVAGLPSADRGGAADSADSQESCLTILRFAAVVAEVFSHRFHHPEKGEILAVVAGNMSWNRKKRPKFTAPSSKAASRPGKPGSVAPATNSARDGPRAWAETGSSLPPASEGAGDIRSKATGMSRAAAKNAPVTVHCAMSYGVSSGPIIAGVLQGRSPMFDIWGPTVNLASRMESTGQPGRIQVSEGVARKVSAVPGQPFHFEPGHTTYCKGFGAVTSYFVRSTSEPPPRDLMVQLGLKPSLGMFYFDNLLTGPKRNTDVRLFAPGTAGSGSQCHSQGPDTHSQHSRSHRDHDTDSQHSGHPGPDDAH
jgi:class 3 adenylate cyclase